MKVENWQVPPTQLSLGKTEIHLWLVELENPLIASLEQMLSPSEINRANRFIFAKDRQRFINGRAALRKIISYYLNIQPSAIVFNYNLYGKPTLADNPSLMFNVSHSHQLAIFGFTWNSRIGVDIEFKKDGIDYKEIAEQFFSRYEQTQLQTAPSLKESFFAIWTRKEAFIKAVGYGLSLALDSFDVSVEADLPAKILAIRNNFSRFDWSIQDIMVNSKYRASFVVEDNIHEVKFWRFTSLHCVS